MNAPAEAEAMPLGTRWHPHCARRVSLALRAGALALLASAACTAPVGADDGEGGWFDFFSDLLKRPEGTPLEVPLRKKRERPEAPPAPVAEGGTSGESPVHEAEGGTPGESPVREAEGGTPGESPAPVAEGSTPGEPPAPVAERSTLGEPPVPEAERSTLGEPSVPVAEGGTPGEPPAPVAEADASAEPPSAANPPPPPPSPPAELPPRLEGAGLAHVARAVEDLVAEIALLREATGDDAPVPAAEPLDDRAPVHLYVKALEVLGKVTHVQRRLGVPAGATVRIPFRPIDAPDVLGLVEHALGEVRRVKARAGVERAIAPAAPESAGAPSALYRRLAHASFLLDALRGGPLTSADVHRHALGALDEVALIGERLGVPVGLDPPPAQAGKTPVEVAQQLLRAAFKAVNLQRRLDMEASPAPVVRLDRADPALNYDLLNGLLAELARIKWHLGIDAAPPERPASPAGAGAGDAFAVAQSMVAQLDRLSKAAAR